MGQIVTATDVSGGLPRYSERVRRAVVEAFEASGLTEAELADRVKGEISRSTLQRRLAGSSFFTNELEAIATALDVPVEQFGAPGRAA